MLVAGVDVGNATTEVALARLNPGREPEHLSVTRGATTGAKGTAESAQGVIDLIERASRRLGERPHRILLADLHPVETGLRELSADDTQDLGGVGIARPVSATPSGIGAAAGQLIDLDDLAGEPLGVPVIPIVGDVDFDVASARLTSARDAGWRIVALVVTGDDGVLIGNRVDRTLPIIDEVADAASLPRGAWAAVEVAPLGGTIAQLADPLRLAVLLSLDPDRARGARNAARALVGHRAGIAVRREASSGGSTRETARMATLRDGTTLPIDVATVPPALGAVASVDDIDAALLDAFWTALPHTEDSAALALQLQQRRAVGLAVLAERGDAGVERALSERTEAEVIVVAAETAAAVAGASTTPGAGHAPIVIDMGGGTVDLHVELDGQRRAVAAAGAGVLVDRICGALLGIDPLRAERAKQLPSVHVETPFILRHEDGGRTFLSQPAPPHTVAHLCVTERREGSLDPLSASLAPEVWGRLRRAAKRDVIAGNLRRAIDAVGGLPQGELAILVGGCAEDAEVVDEVSLALADLDLAIARGNVLGQHGPRAAVAVGLVLLHARGA
ncbi:MAG: diol dehydratase reactivase ATPase-like domain-containing protein [Gaiellales bacterium]